MPIFEPQKTYVSCVVVFVVKEISFVGNLCVMSHTPRVTCVPRNNHSREESRVVFVSISVSHSSCCILTTGIFKSRNSFFFHVYDDVNSSSYTIKTKMTHIQLRRGRDKKLDVCFTKNITGSVFFLMRQPPDPLLKRFFL